MSTHHSPTSVNRAKGAGAELKNNAPGKAIAGFRSKAKSCKKKSALAQKNVRGRVCVASLQMVSILWSFCSFASIQVSRIPYGKQG